MGVYAEIRAVLSSPPRIPGIKTGWLFYSRSLSEAAVSEELQDLILYLTTFY